MPRALDGRLAPEAEPGRGALPGEAQPPHRSTWACTTTRAEAGVLHRAGAEGNSRGQRRVPGKGKARNCRLGDTRELSPARVPPEGDEHADNV